MNGTVSEWLDEAESKLAQGDWVRAGVLVNQSLKTDFTNPRAWELLYRLRGETQSMTDFKIAFARKYFPDQAHQVERDTPLVVEPIQEQPLPAGSPGSASILPTPPSGHLPALICPSCHKPIRRAMRYCIYCGSRLIADGYEHPAAMGWVPPGGVKTPELPRVPPFEAGGEVSGGNQPVQGKPGIPEPPPAPLWQPVAEVEEAELTGQVSLSLVRLSSVVGIFSRGHILMDGTHLVDLRNGEEKLVGIAPGRHTFKAQVGMMRSATIALTCQPAEPLQLVVQPGKWKAREGELELSVIDPRQPFPRARSLTAFLGTRGCLVALGIAVAGGILGLVGGYLLLSAWLF